MAYVSKKSSCLQGEFIDVGLSLYETEAAIQAGREVRLTLAAPWALASATRWEMSWLP